MKSERFTLSGTHHICRRDTGGGCRCCGRGWELFRSRGRGICPLRVCRLIGMAWIKGSRRIR